MKATRVGLKLGVAFSLLIATIALLAFFGLRRMSLTNSDIQQVVWERWSKVQLAGEALHCSSLNSRITLQIFLMTDRKQIDDLLADRARNTDAITRLLGEIESKVESEGERSLLAKIISARQTYKESYETALALLLNKGDPDLARRTMIDSVLPKLLVYQNAWESFIAFQNARMSEADAVADSEYLSARRTVVELLLLAVSATMVIGVVVIRRVVKEISWRHHAELELREAGVELRAAKEELEVRVDERTMELANANALLQAEVLVRTSAEQDLRLANDAANGARILAQETRDLTIFAMAKLAESRDPETGAHLERVRGYCHVLAQELARTEKYRGVIDAEFIHLIYMTSPLHDIGKVGIPDDILMKPGRLTDREFAVMKTHAQIGARTLDAALKKFPGVRFLEMARDIAATHHEWFDGTGYPHGLKGDQIPLCGRIMALADVYDALCARRVYKAAFSHERASGIILGESGSHFDPEIVEAYRRCEGQFIAIHKSFDDTTAAAA